MDFFCANCLNIVKTVFLAKLSMEYTYLLFSFAFLIVWIFVFTSLSDLKKSMLKVSFLGALSGIPAQNWYLSDYWNPPTILGQGHISVEDILSGFGIIGCTVFLFNAVFKTKEVPSFQPQNKLLTYLFALGIAGVILALYVGINTMIATSSLFLIIAIFMLWKRPDLLNRAIISALFSFTLAFVIYFTVFTVIMPGFWESVWKVESGLLRTFLVGEVPLIEAFWFISWGAFSGIVYNFYKGTVSVPSRFVKLVTQKTVSTT